jgi:hypothetical protein
MVIQLHLSSVSDNDLFHIHPKDNVVVALGHFEPNSTIEGGHIVIRQSILAGHKIATETIHQGAFIRKARHDPASHPETSSPVNTCTPTM